jgi:hypothetical protein
MFNLVRMFKDEIIIIDRFDTREEAEEMLLVYEANELGVLYTIEEV